MTVAGTKDRSIGTLAELRPGDVFYMTCLDLGSRVAMCLWSLPCEVKLPSALGPVWVPGRQIGYLYDNRLQETATSEQYEVHFPCRV